MKTLAKTTYTGGDGGDGYLDDPAGRLAEIVTSGVRSRCYTLAEKLAARLGLPLLPEGSEDECGQDVSGKIDRGSAEFAALVSEIEQVFGVSSTENDDWSVVSRTACGITVRKTLRDSNFDALECFTLDHYDVEVSV